MSIFHTIIAVVLPGMTLPGTRYTVKCVGQRHGERALVYRIPSNTPRRKPSEKGVSESEVEQAHTQLLAAGVFTRRWFLENMPECEKAGPCQFLAIGAVFVALGLAVQERGRFVLVTLPPKPSVSRDRQ